jgi:uncharacterized membrane protein HdeD (DUF308 family)
VLVTLIAAWSIITSIFEIATAEQLRKLIANEWLMILSGVVSIVWLLGGYALIFGILTLMLAFRVRGMRDLVGRHATGAV